MKNYGLLLICILVMLILPGSLSAQTTSLTSTFTYQGHLTGANGAVSGTCDFQFSLYDALTSGTQVGSTITSTNVIVSNGTFNVQLDFGATAFDGTDRYLEIAVRCPAGSGSYTTLAPRQTVTAAPYAIYSSGGEWSGLLGVPPGFQDDIDNDVLGELICANGQIARYSGTAWVCVGDSSGDVTSVTAGTGLSGGGTFGDVTLSADTGYLQRRITGTCAAGSSIRVINADGTVTCQTDTEGNDWTLTGNSGTNPISQFIGTTDNQRLEFRVNNVRALMIQPNATSPNLIGGYSGNSVAVGVVGATIGGGGESGLINSVTTDYGTVSGGTANSASGNYATIGGGTDNTASNLTATVAGGWGNTVSSPGGTVGGGYFNTVSGQDATVGGGGHNSANAMYGTIGGGGPSDTANPITTSNRVLDNYGTIGGGGGNRAGNGTGTFIDAFYATIGGGRDNIASDEGATVGGGFNNTASVNVATVGGGSTNTANGDSATISGGYNNTASSIGATISGGQGNNASGSRATIGGGYSNTASSDSATVSGGFNNMASADVATVGGGQTNVANGDAATISGGWDNTASSDSATVSGGWDNTASGSRSTVGGGNQNVASGNLATVPGGYANVALGETSFAAGRQAKANHDGAFVWADDSALDFASTGANQFLARAVGGFYFYTNTALTNGCTLPPGGGAWSCTSDRNAKENIAPVDPQAVLQSVASMPIATWNYITQDDEIRHIGPMAQDFYAAFGVGEDDTHITTIDADGVALAAIQGLNQLLEEKDAKISDLQGRVDDLEARLSTLEQAGNTQESSLMLPMLAFGGLALAGMWLRRVR